MKRVLLNRAFQNGEVTLGILKVLDHSPQRPFFTLENPWLMNVPFESCIPPGDYLCKAFSGRKYSAVFELVEVPKRSYILIHPGNVVSHTSGCILLGLSAGELEGETAVLQSREAIALFRAVIGDESFHLRISQG